MKRGWWSVQQKPGVNSGYMIGVALWSVWKVGDTFMIQISVTM
ncbi:hypothetical protein [Paenibacillus sp. P32E]|nr:hypothetical protein [Paenibacillus sp. P32E]